MLCEKPIKVENKTHTALNDEADAVIKRKQSVQLIIPNVTYIHIKSIHTYIVYTTQTHIHVCVCVCSILSAKVQQQNALEIKKK